MPLIIMSSPKMARQMPRGNPISVTHKISPIIKITSPMLTVMSFPVKPKISPMSFQMIVNGSRRRSINKLSIHTLLCFF